MTLNLGHDKIKILKSRGISMRKYVRFSALMLVMMLIISAFGGCRKKNEEDITSTISASTDDISFVNKDGGSTYRIVRPEENNVVTAKVGADVFRAIKQKYGVSVQNVSDEVSGDGFAEIIIGNCNREESKVAYDMLLSSGAVNFDEYIICTISDDIVIIGMTDNATLMAVEYFISNYITGDVIVGGINYIHKSENTYQSVSIFGKTVLNDIKIVRPIYNVSYITQMEIDKLVENIRSKTGQEIEVVNDTVVSRDDTAELERTTPCEYEIIIGNCDRDGVTKYDDSSKGVYEIRIEQKKIYLNGGSPYATALAVTEFTNLVKQNTVITSDMSVEKGDYNKVVKTYDSAEYYYPTWTEDFDGNEINYTNWNVEWDVQSSVTHADNGKIPYRGSLLHKNNYVKKGKLYICGIETDNAYYGGMFHTINKMEYLYGHIEISTLHPKGLGFWTALWTQSSAYGENEIPSNERLYFIEVDVEECYGNGGDWAYGNVFAWPTSLGRQELSIPANSGTILKSNRIENYDGRGFYMDFHTFGYEWIDNTHVRFTRDGYVYADVELDEPAMRHAYLQPTYLRLSMACGSGNHGQPTTDKNEWQNTNKYIVDWIHIYQKKGQKLFLSNQGGWKEYVR